MPTSRPYIVTQPNRDSIAALPELIAQTNMDQQSVNRLREELAKFMAWLEKHIPEYYVTTYESPAADYADKVKH